MTHSGDSTPINLTTDFQNYTPRVAYTCGDFQPVRSTYIAHDPYFFMDVSEETLEEELLAELDQHIFSSEYGASFEDEQRVQDILDRFDTAAFSLSGNFFPSSSLMMQDVYKIMEKSRYCGALLEFARANDIHIIPSPMVELSEYNRAENVILVQPELGEVDMIKALCISLRQAWQNYSGALLQPVSLYPDHAVFVNRAQKADLSVNLVRIAWELELAGYTKLWDDLEKGAMQDLAHSFAREAVRDFRTLNNGFAALSAFESWFLSDRSKNSDNGLIQRMLGDYSGHQFEDEEMSQLVMIDLIRALGEMPYGKNYLAQYIPQILTDPVFTEIRERSAANFLWFIKFEKTFNEMEHALQKEGSLKSGTFPSRTSLKNEQSDESNIQTGILLSFPSQPSSEKSAGPQRSATTGSAEVIPFTIADRPFNSKFPL